MFLFVCMFVLVCLFVCLFVLLHSLGYSELCWSFVEIHGFVNKKFFEQVQFNTDMHIQGSSNKNYKISSLNFYNNRWETGAIELMEGLLVCTLWQVLNARQSSTNPFT